MGPYHSLVNRVIDYGEVRQVRNGTTLQRFGETLLAHDVSADFPIVATRDVPWRSVMGELAAFLKGATLVEEFEAYGCKYWNMNAEQWRPGKGEVGRVYGAQWREWRGANGKTVDQLQQLIKGLLADPTGRRHILTTWQPAELDDMCLPPCHILAQFNRSGSALDCLVTMRSVDLCLGLPADIVLYATLLHLVAQEVRIQSGEACRPRKLLFCFGDAHVYTEHLKQWEEQRQRKMSFDCVKLNLGEGNGLFDFNPFGVELIGYKPHPKINYRLL